VNERFLSLCSGVGLLDRAAASLFPGAVSVGYVEREAQAIEVLAARMSEGSLSPAPVWLDVVEFDPRQSGVEADVVVAGFPCQPFSAAGKRRGDKDERWLWDDVWRITRDSGAWLGMFENVPGLLTRGLHRILADVAAFGWDAEWGTLSAADVGAPHRRERLFLVVADPHRKREQQPQGPIPKVRERAEHGGWGPGTAPEPTVPGVDDGVAKSVARDGIFLVGNGVVPQQVATAYRTLLARLAD
jgi:DNA (cytosine-5)-methyltransferase 1